MNALSFSLVLLQPLSVTLGFVFGGAWVWSTPVLLFVLTPVFDAVFGLDTHNPDDDEQAARANNWLYDAWLYLWVPLQLAFIGWGLLEVTTASSWMAAAGMTVSVGMMTGAAGITIAHELMHRPTRWENAMAEVLMTSVSYPHFCVEHILGHHKNVATPDDPASAQRGVGVYRYLPRTLWGSLASAWRLEAERLERANVSAWSMRDRRLRMPVLWLALLLLVAVTAGSIGLAFFVGQGVVAVILVEVINYIEHYGLRREQLEDGRYERVLPRHSWNSAHWLTGRYLFNLPRHADHHFIASRPYWKLRHLEDSPQLPAGYGTMVLLALVPPMWFRVMNPRVDAWNAALREGTPR